ncbi:MAG: quinolinate synthase NadA [Elusimicrobia bacterium]|nr:quinolinate synthase NadA [Elusimicrobiota bacterium]MDE2509642.1 quinolinate synthase NadA [Elusimicrobiota bacterium]
MALAIKERRAPEPTPAEISAEAERLADKGLADLGWQDAELERAARLTWKINKLKKELHAVIPAHVYQRAEIMVGVADFVGDSYKLAKMCADSDAERIVFCGVRFMAETAKILNPEKEVLLPAPEAGCSLSESITAAEVRALKKKHPGAPVVTYINTSAAVKAESDVIVTSANAPKILRKLYAEHEKIVFIPDAMMGRNLAKELGKKLGSELVVWDGSCIVHDNFDSASVEFYRKMYPGVKILAHFECSPGLVSVVDYIGGTGDMMKWVADNKASSYMLITECGLGDLARTKFPEKAFVPMCRLCPYMKATDLSRILRALERPAASQRIEVSAAVRERARRPIERMFELAEDKAAS